MMRYILCAFLCIGCTTYDTDADLERDGFEEYYSDGVDDFEEPEPDRKVDSVAKKRPKSRRRHK
jgi:hypothetical protein